MFFKGWPDPPDLTIKYTRKPKRKRRHRRPQPKPNPERRRRKLWLRQNPPGSPGRIAWEESKAMRERFRELIASDD